ncbi:hypothetical protein V8C37DRAFT_413741 [Trichoderma ceciliae]
MAAELPFIFGEAVSLEDAENTDDNVINKWKQDRATAQLYKDLWGHRDTMESLTKHHLGLKNGHISIIPQSKWKRGGFNICMPIHVTSRQKCRQFIMRCPTPHKLAKAQYRGSVNEKMSCEFTHERQRPCQMLSTTWEEHRNNPSRRARLFQRISRLVLSLARIPQPRIGSFQFHPDCTIALTNRPLTCTTILLENEGAPRLSQ